MEKTDLSPLPFAEFVGFSPGGVEWVAYKPEHVEKMRARLEKLWAVALAGHRRYECFRTARLTEAQMGLVEDELGRLAGDRLLHSHVLMALDMGKTFLRGPQWALDYVAEGVEFKLDDEFESRVGENTYVEELTEAQVTFGAASMKRSVQKAVKALRKTRS